MDFLGKGEQNKLEVLHNSIDCCDYQLICFHFCGNKWFGHKLLMKLVIFAEKRYF
jgi:hypothetical protein